MQSINASIQKGVAITPNDATVVSCDALWIGTGGDLTLDHGDGPVLYKNVPGGTFFETAGCIVRSTGTVAADIVAVTWNRK